MVMIKKKHSLKKKYRRLILYLVLLVIVACTSIHFINIYKYHQTDEYKLLELGYSEKSVSNILTKLDKSDVDKILSKTKINYIDEVLNQKYFLKKHLFDYIEYYSNNTDKSFYDVIAIINVGSDKPWYQGSVEADTTKGEMILANKFHLLNNDYDAGEIKSFSATYAYGTVKASKVVYDAFIKMANEAKKDGVTLVLSSGYREHSYQEKLYNDMIKSKGQEYADKYAAKPGASEHETGLALDILSTGKGAYTNNFHETEAYAWLCDHAHEYGFILRYPEGKEYLTGYNPESWHYRYLGVELATKVKNEGITYDEYYAYYLDN